jgi:hypothetical protein
MRFEIYDKSRLDDQVKFIDEVTNSWKWKPWYPSKEELSEIYSRENFTADTRHYVYDGNKLVAFLSSAVEGIVDGEQTGSIHIPFVREGYNEVKESLMTKTIETLKIKGVKTIFAYKRDRELVIEMVHKTRGIPRKKVEEIVDDLIAKDLVVAGSLMQDGDDVAGGLLYRAYQPDKSFLRIFCLSKNKEKNLIADNFEFLVSKADEAGIELLWHQVPDTSFIDHYKKFNLNFEPFNEYILKLTLVDKI